MQKLIFFFVATLVSFLLIKCSNSSPEDLIDVNNSTIKYSTDIKPIIDSKCTVCHAAVPTNGAPMPLIDNEKVKEAILNRGLLERINRPASDPGLMPLGGPKLPSNQINLITKWKEDGFVN